MTDELKLPPRMRGLRLDARLKRRVPWFVRAPGPVPGSYDFRVVEKSTYLEAIRREVCWVCGHPLGRHRAFVIGPMCGVNRVTSEPPVHRDCGEYSARACPFLSNPKAVRRTAGLAPEVIAATSVPGIMLARNPGVTLLWRTDRVGYGLERAGKGLLFRLGPVPLGIDAFAAGRRASREELATALELGVPAVTELAVQEGERAVEALKDYLGHAAARFTAAGLLTMDAASEALGRGFQAGGGTA